MLFGLGQFMWGQKYLHGHAESPAAEKLRERVLAAWTASPARLREDLDLAGVPVRLVAAPARPAELNPVAAR